MASEGVSADFLALGRVQLPLSTDVQPIRLGGLAEAWRDQGRVVGLQADIEVQPMGAVRL